MNWLEVGKDIATICGALITAASAVIATLSLRSVVRTNKAKFVFDLTESFLKEEELRKFWYRLNYTQPKYEPWIFDLSNFRNSPEERHLDALLYKFGVAGRMLKTKAVNIEDIEGLFVLCRQTFENNHVKEYLRFHRLDFSLKHTLRTRGFSDALYLYEQLTIYFVNAERAPPGHKENCENLLRELDRIAVDKEFQKETAARIKYRENET